MITKIKKYLVGGAVRDDLLNLPIKDKDWVVIGATPQEMINIGFRQVGKDFPVFLDPNNHEEYALARTERKSGKGYTGFICHTSPNITLEEDLYRRDLTINAIARDDQGNIIDPYNGQKDLKLRILRHVSNLFQEDPLRVLRVARLAAQLTDFNFKIAPETLTLMKNMSNELIFLPPERIWIETKKALSTHNPSIYFKILKNCNALKIIFPEINNLFKLSHSIKWRNIINIGFHTMKALTIAVKLTNSISIRFAILCHDLGIQKQNLQRKWNNKVLNNIHTEDIDNLCKRLKVPTQLHNLVKITTKYHACIHNIHNKTTNKILHLFNNIDVWRHPERLEQILIVGESDYRGRIGYEKKIYHQKFFLRQAYYIAKSINTAKIINQGISGINIKKEIHRERYKALIIWKNISPINKKIFKCK